MKYAFTNKGRNGFFDCKEALVSIDDNLLKLEKKVNGRNRRLYVIFSKNCNLRCVYCFQKNDLKSQCKDSVENVVKICRESLCDFDEIVLFGGEPLLDDNLDAVQEMLSCKLGLPIYIFTNGNISQKAKEIVISNKDQLSRIVITLDGTRAVHDKLRVNIKGSSFDNAWTTAKQFISEKLSVQIQINVDSRNQQDVQNLLVFLENDTDLPLNIMLNPIKYSPYTLKQEQLLELYIDLKKKHPSLDIQVNSRLIRNLFNLLCGEAFDGSRCDLEQTVVADFSSGKIYACPHNESSNIGFIAEKMYYDHEKIGGLLQRVNYYNAECASCEYDYLCAYGCPFEKSDFTKCKESMDSALKVIFDNFDVLFDVED